VVKLCTYCGHILPNDNARFCNNCGKSLLSQTSGPISIDGRPGNTTTPAQQPSLDVGQQGDIGVPPQNPQQALREQIAQQPFSRSAKYSLPQEPPPWMNQLEKRVYEKQPPRMLDNQVSDKLAVSRNNTQDSSTTPAEPQQELAPGDPEAENLQHAVPAPNDAQSDIAAAATTPSEEIHPARSLTSIPLHKLRVRVWGHEDNVNPPAQEEDIGSAEAEEHVAEDLPTSPLSVAGTPGFSIQSPALTSSTVENFTAEEEKTGEEEKIVDDLPTRPLVATLPEVVPARDASTQSAPGSVHSPGFDEVEELDTRPIHSQRQGQALSLATGPAAGQRWQAFRNQAGPLHGSVVQNPVTPAPLAQPQVQPAKESRHTPPVSVAVPPFSRLEHWRRNRKRLLFVFVLLFILLLGATVAWINVTQPFTVSPVTQTTQSFRNSDIGVSLQYPRSWTVQLDKNNAAISFYDDNQTDQFKINTAAINGRSIDQYISKEVASLGMTGQKPGGSLSFAGTSWQQVQGNTLQSGASYMATLLVTTHGDRYYAIIELAPTPTFAQEDQVVFSHIRSSFQLI
jgi:hypothetical protein